MQSYYATVIVFWDKITDDLIIAYGYVLCSF